MPVSCSVHLCRSRADRDPVNFYRFPSLRLGYYKHKPELLKLAQKRRTKWINAVRRKDLTDASLKYARICSKHFIGGKPADFLDENSPDWVPSIALEYSLQSGQEDFAPQNIARYKRAKTRVFNLEAKDDQNQVDVIEQVSKMSPRN